MDPEEFNEQFQQYALSCKKHKGKICMRAVEEDYKDPTPEIVLPADTIPKKEFNGFSTQQMHLM